MHNCFHGEKNKVGNKIYILEPILYPYPYIYIYTHKGQLEYIYIYRQYKCE